MIANYSTHYLKSLNTMNQLQNPIQVYFKSSVKKKNHHFLVIPKHLLWNSRKLWRNVFLLLIKECGSWKNVNMEFVIKTSISKLLSFPLKINDFWRSTPKMYSPSIFIYSQLHNHFHDLDFCINITRKDMATIFNQIVDQFTCWWCSENWINNKLVHWKKHHNLSW